MFIKDAATAIGKALYLKSHIAGLGKLGRASSDADGRARVHLCGDVEVHRGRDQRSYVIDVARLMPPEAPAMFVFGVLFDCKTNVIAWFYHIVFILLYCFISGHYGD